MIGIINDAACILEQPKESSSSTKVTTIDRGRLVMSGYSETTISDDVTLRSFDIGSLCPDDAVTGGANGRFEITVKFTPGPDITK
jgi:hypothetical protein